MNPRWQERREVLEYGQNARTQTIAAVCENQHRRKLLVALAILLVAVGVVIGKNIGSWMSPDDTTVADEQTPVAVATTTAPPTAPSFIEPGSTAPVAEVKKHVAAKAPSTQAASQKSEESPIVVSQRAVLPPFAIEVVAGSHANRRDSNSLKIETVPESGFSQNGEAAVTNAAQRAQLNRASVQPASYNVTYPLLARQMKVQGSVLLEALIAADGVIRELRVLSGPPILASAAREAAMQWRFKPYLQNGNPVETTARITVNFTIKVLDNVIRDQQDTLAMSEAGGN